MSNCNCKQAKIDSTSDATNTTARNKIRVSELTKALNKDTLSIIGIMGFTSNGCGFQLFEADMKEDGTLYGCVRADGGGRGDDVVFAYVLPMCNLSRRINIGRKFTELVSGKESAPTQLRMNNIVPPHIGLKAIVEGGRFVKSVSRDESKQKCIDEFNGHNIYESKQMSPTDYLKRCEQRQANERSRKTSFASKMNDTYQPTDPITKEIMNDFRRAMKEAPNTYSAYMNHPQFFKQFYEEEMIHEATHNFDFDTGMMKKEERKHVTFTPRCEVVLVDDGEVCTVTFTRRKANDVLTFDDMIHYLKRIEREW